MSTKNKLSFSDVCAKFYEHNKQHNITGQYEDKKPLYAVVVFSQASFRQRYSLKSRSYRFRSDEKYFVPGMGGNSLFADCLDESEHGVRLDWYLRSWKVEYCYMSRKPQQKEGE